MTVRAAHTLDPDAAVFVGDAGLRAVRAFRRMAERSLVHGDPDERTLAAKILSCLDQGDVRGFMAALGLSGPGWTGAMLRHRQERRDEALRAIRRAHFSRISTNSAAEIIAQHWHRYKAGAWPRHRDAGTEPTNALDAALHRLLVASHKPRAAETIRRILGSDVGHLQTLEPPKPSADLE